MIERRFTAIPCVSIIFLQSGRILLQRRIADKKFEPPGGNFNGNETMIQAAIRVAREEVAVVIGPDDMDLVHVMHRRNPPDEVIHFYVRAKRWQGEPRLIEKRLCDDLVWHPIISLPSGLDPFQRQAVDRITKGRVYSEHGF